MGGKPLPLYDSYSIIVAQNESLTPIDIAFNITIHKKDVSGDRRLGI
jgi:hypothetical protein